MKIWRQKSLKMKKKKKKKTQAKNLYKCFVQINGKAFYDQASQNEEVWIVPLSKSRSDGLQTNNVLIN